MMFDDDVATAAVGLIAQLPCWSVPAGVQFNTYGSLLAITEPARNAAGGAFIRCYACRGLGGIATVAEKDDEESASVAAATRLSLPDTGASCTTFTQAEDVMALAPSRLDRHVFTLSISTGEMLASYHPSGESLLRPFATGWSTCCMARSPAHHDVLVAGVRDGPVQFYHLSCAKAVAHLDEASTGTSAVGISASGKHLAVADERRLKVYEWRLMGHGPMVDVEFGRVNVLRTAAEMAVVHRDETHLVSSRSRLRSCAPLRDAISPDAAPIAHVAFHPVDDTALLLTTQANVVAELDIASMDVTCVYGVSEHGECRIPPPTFARSSSGELPAREMPARQWVCAAQYSPDGGFVAAGGGLSRTYLFDAAEGELIKGWKIPRADWSSVAHVAWHPTVTMFAAGTSTSVNLFCARATSARQ